MSYSVTQGGEVFGPRGKMKGQIIKGGYIRVNLGGQKKLVHRFVLETFVGPCPEGMEARHLDGNPANNRLSNLCWSTHKENVRDQYKHGTAVFGYHSCKPVRCSNGKVFESIEEAARQTKVFASSISEVCSGKRKTAGGLKWQLC